MKQQGCIVSLVFFIMLFGDLCLVESGKASILETSSHRSRSTQERGGTGYVDTCAGIIGRLDWNEGKPPETPCPTLEVWVPKREGFTEFVKVDDESKMYDGFSIAIFCYALQVLQWRFQPNFTTFVIDKEKGTYDEFILEFSKEKNNCKASAGDITIRSTRTEYVSFTTSYLTSEVYMLVHGAHEWNQTLWTFLRPFTARLWVAVFGACILIGVALVFLEYRAKNPEFKSPFYSQLIMIIWFPISKFFFQEGRIYNRNSKVVLVVWLSTIFVILQIFTATLSSWLTLDQLSPRIPSRFEKIGYQEGSYLKEFILSKHNSTIRNLLPLKSVEEYKNALSNGSVDVIFDELPYVDLFLAKYGSDYMKIGPINQESGIAFAVPSQTPWLEDFSRAVINVTESDIMMEMKKRYLGFSTPYQSEPNSALPQSLDVQSFIGLFIFMGVVTIAAIISSEISLMRRNGKVEDEQIDLQHQATIRDKPQDQATLRLG